MKPLGYLAGVVVTLMMAAPVAAADTVGLVDGETGQWHVFDDAFGRTSFFFGNPGDTPFAGDWDCDGDDTPGLFRASDAFVYLRNSNDQGVADIRFFFGDPGDQPLVGDFNGDGCDTVSIYRPATQQFFVVNALGADDGGLGAADFSFGFGNPGDTPVAGDWDADGITEVGLYRQSTGFFYWRNTLDTGVASDDIFFGDPGDQFVAGDWGLVDGVATPAVYRGGNASFFFRHTLTEGVADRHVATGWSGLIPVSGSFGPLGATTPHLGLSPVGTFASPLLVTAPAGDHRMFVVQKGGAIKVIDGGVTSTFLDVSSLTTGGGERGLLGMAFHPTENKVYVSYTNGAGNSVLAEYAYAGSVADPGSRRVVHTTEQPNSNHNGGMVAFGPDGLLYWGLGDGGGGGDPNGNGQNPSTKLGAVLRLDTDGVAAPGNPFVGGGGAPEVFVYGLRNPWRFSFDGSDLYIGDVGQDRWEEVSVVDVATDGGANLGWNRTEGDHCYRSGCSFSGITPPIVEYSHADGCSVTGGYVYRGLDLPGLEGTYLYGDLCSGRVWSFRLVDGVATDRWELTGEFGTVSTLSSFGIDGSGELYAVSLSGTVFKVVAG